MAKSNFKRKPNKDEHSEIVQPKSLQEAVLFILSSATGRSRNITNEEMASKIGITEEQFMQFIYGSEETPASLPSLLLEVYQVKRVKVISWETIEEECPDPPGPPEESL